MPTLKSNENMNFKIAVKLLITEMTQRYSLMCSSDHVLIGIATLPWTSVFYNQPILHMFITKLAGNLFLSDYSAEQKCMKEENL